MASNNELLEVHHYKVSDGLIMDHLCHLEGIPLPIQGESTGGIADPVGVVIPTQIQVYGLVSILLRQFI